MIDIITVRIAAEADIARVRQVADKVAQSFGLESFARTRMVTAVLEISRNALQYGGGGQVRFSATPKPGGSEIGVRVTDQGTGIDNPAAFERERRPYLETKAATRGLGLGLSGVKRLADNFDIASSPQGTRVAMAFFVPVPADEIARRAAAAAEAVLGLGSADPIAELSRQNRELAAAMAERELLIDEVHHRTGNNLALIVSFIQMSKRKAASPETRQAMAELEARVHSVARVHQELQRAQQSDRIELLPLLENVAKHASDAFSSVNLSVDIDVAGEPVEVVSSTAIDLGLIVGELITNAFKHAFEGRSKGRIAIRFDRTEGADPGWVLIVRDDGVGTPEDARPDRPQSLGWRMIRAMSARHAANIETDGSDGFCCAITFPQSVVRAPNTADTDG